VHQLRQLGTTYSLVDALPEANAICAAIAAGRVRVESRPLTWVEATTIMTTMVLSHARPHSHRDDFTPKIAAIDVDDSNNPVARRL
jgi:hypothetical protein